MQQQHEQRGPDQIELLFDAERPGVQEQVPFRRDAEVIHIGRGEVHVAEPHSGAGCRRCLLCLIHRRQQDRADDRADHEHGEEGGYQTPCASCVEVQEIDSPGVHDFAEKQSGYEESGQYEEDIDADESTGQARHACVCEYHQYDRKRAQAFDIAAEWHVASTDIRWLHCIASGGREWQVSRRTVDVGRSAQAAVLPAAVRVVGRLSSRCACARLMRKQLPPPAMGTYSSEAWLASQSWRAM